MEILQLLNELEAMGERGEKAWICKVFLLRKLVLDADEFYDMVHKMRTSLPEEMTHASQVTRQREEIIEQAHNESQKIIDGARQQAQLLVSNDELLRQAQGEAEKILQQARVDANAIRSDAQQWARGIVERLENYISRISATVDKTKSALSTQGPSPAPQSPPDPSHFRDRDTHK